MIRQNLILYHCNDFFRCHRFVHTEDYMIVSKEDGNWLGTGMYFFFILANAEYWMRKKKKKSFQTPPQVNEKAAKKTN